MSDPSSSSLCLRALRVIALALGAVLVWFGTLGWPIPMGDGLDASWNFVLGYARLHHLQFGTEIVFTYGPWGYLTMPYMLPELFGDRVAWEFLFKAGLAMAVTLCAARLPWWRALMLIIFSALMLAMFGDASYNFVLAVLLWSNATAINPDRRLAPAASGAVLGFFALQKFTFFVFTTAGIGGVCCVLIARRHLRPALWLSGAWLVAIIVSWLAAAQSVSGLPFFVWRSLAQSAAYQESMVFDESAGVFWWGVATLLTCFLGVALAVRHHRQWPTLARLFLASLGCGLCFLVWKQSFIRADGHVMGLFLFAAAIGLAARHLVGVALGAIALVGFWTAEPNLFGQTLHLFRYHIEEDVTKLRSLAATREQLAQQTEAARTLQQLPSVRARVGDQSVDVFGFEQVVAYWNGLNYHPRPAFQSYQVTSPGLTQLNADFYASPRAPEFVLAKLDSIDGRYPAMDDARALRALAEHYAFEFEEQGWLLLRRRSLSSTLPPSRPLKLAMTIGDPLSVPDSATPMWAKINLRPSWLGLLRTFVYKPRLATLEITTSDGGAQNFRIASLAAQGGFYLSPVLTNTAGLRAFLTGAPLPAPTSINIGLAPKHRKYFRPRVEVKLYP